MQDESKNLARLIGVRDEAEAALIVAALADHNIRAVPSGAYTSGFRAVPVAGDVSVLVEKADLDRAKEVMAAMHTERDNIDWSQVDVGEQESC
ncbi:MAG: DUF2007 domain-containing protein [Planctomycetaceae bacterium]